MDKVQGEVVELVVYPGRTDVITVRLRTDGKWTQASHLVAIGKDAELFVNGGRMDVAGLFVFLIYNRVNVTLYPKVDRYGVSTRSEFTTVNQGGS